MPAPEGLAVAQAHEQHPERIAVLRGRRLVVSSELEASAVLAEAAVKVLTGGDTLSARQLYGQRFTFRPTHKVVLVTNHKPKVVGTDLAIWRRLRLVPFAVTMAPEEQDPDLRRRLAEDHGSAVLAWLVAGARNWNAEGLGSAAAVETATADYRSSQDTFGTWLAECTVVIPRARTKIGDLWASWREWCEQVGERPGRKQDLRSALDGHSVVVETYQGAKYAVGLGIVVPDAQSADQGNGECGEVS
jgi:putative DNA primase/helicase